MDAANDTRDRIFGAANRLYEQAGHAAFPTVDAVRKAARVNMNDASAGMKEWRHAQLAHIAPVAVQVPDAIQLAAAAGLASLWKNAQDLANESLRAARVGWDAERAEADTVSKQIADAYEVQAVELASVQVAVARLTASVDQASMDLARSNAELAAAQRELVAARAAVERAEAQSVEIERRAADLRGELDHAHRDTTDARSELASVRQTHTQESEALRTSALVAHRAAQAAMDQMRAEVNQVREDAAALRGQFEAVKAQNIAMMQTVSTRKVHDNAKVAR